MSVLTVNITEGGYTSGRSTIHNIAFQINEGELIGLIGPNGAGKSTTIKSIIGLLPHMVGTITIKNGEGTYSYIPEQPILYDGLTLQEHIELAISAHDKQNDETRTMIRELLQKFRLESFIHHYPTTFSKGMQQKVMLILSFMIRPDIYIIDEPFIGLDPVAIRDFLDLLQQERQRGAAVLMSTHVLDSAERICDRIILLHEGNIAASGTLQQIQEQCQLPNGTLFDCFHQIMQG